MTDSQKKGNELVQPRLDDRYTLQSGSVFLSGNQALVRLPIQQRLIDNAAGLDTAGFISGYRGSPLGRYDMELWQAESRLKELRIKFQPGVNEELAATAVWGSQCVGLFPGAKAIGVFGLWYGKGPGVDRALDALKHGNYAGTSPYGGALVLAGDDPGAKSSTVAHQSDQALIAAGIPVLAPSNVQDILDLGLHGLAMSRYSGCWVGMKMVTDVLESSMTVDIGLDRFHSTYSEEPIPTGVSIRTPDAANPQELRHYQDKLPRVLAYSRDNHLNQMTHNNPGAKIGIVAPGKAYADTLQALALLNLTNKGSNSVPFRLLKVGMIWPLESEAVLQFSEGLTTILVVEEKRSLLEYQVKDILYDQQLDVMPKVAGKSLLPEVGEISPIHVAHAIANVMGRNDLVKDLPLPKAPKFLPDGRPDTGPLRTPTFCSGCPHNLSTKVPDGSRALAGIGCHAMARVHFPNKTMSISQMGGEGVMWVGQAPFTEEPHVFANMGDGTYFHSGVLAIRQAVASGVNITYKLLYNGFVAMTGGQPIDGELSVPRLVQQLLDEGVSYICVVTEDVARVKSYKLPQNVPIFHRRHLEKVQLMLREMKGTSVLLYDQPCAAERRRLRKRGKWLDPKIRTFIHPEICEGCGDCGDKSGCLSIEPLDTPVGRKRKINQSNCNKDFSCVDGFCPSFVTVHGAEIRKRVGQETSIFLGETVIPEPDSTLKQEQFGILFAGIGGTGVVTVSALVSMAAHLDGLAVSTLDLTGLSQKFGAVMTHMRISRDRNSLTTARLAMGEADVVVGCDLLVTAGDEALDLLRPGSARLVISSEEAPTAAFSRNPDWDYNRDGLLERIRSFANDRFELVDAAHIATELLGDAVFSNILLLGVTWQRGLIPVSLSSLIQSIQLNGVAPERNLAAFTWGRLLVTDPEKVKKALNETGKSLDATGKETLEDLIYDRVQRLTEYQNSTYAHRYQERIERLRASVANDAVGEQLLKQVARQYFRLLAHKDEYEIGRLYSSPEFHKMIEHEFEGNLKIHFHLGGGPLARKDKETGQPLKTEITVLVPQVMWLLGKMRRFRGTAFDFFKHSPERKLAKQLLNIYEEDIDRVINGLACKNSQLAAELLKWPELVRGYGYIRENTANKALVEREKLMESI